MEKNIIVFYAPVGTNLTQYQIGGGEIGCRRTREILKKHGFEVITIDKPIMEKKGLMNYFKMALKGYTRLWKALVSNNRAILYTVGFYERNVYLEWLIIMTGKLLSRRTIYEARNGRLVKAYYEYGKLYKLFMDSILMKVDTVFCQGLEYVRFIEQRYKKRSVYSPNYVMNKFLKEYSADRPLDVIRLIYFGRVTEAKNIGVIVEVCSELLKRGYKVETIIIGAYTEEYKRDLDQFISNLYIPKDTIRFLGHQPFEIISAELQKAHFFIFPSQEKKEGHSNSLTEAMTFGVVPIVSSAGFNSSIVAKPELVVNDIDARRYADVVDKIIQDMSWGIYSKFVYDRIRENYTEDRVKTSILKAISELVE
ncbi:glycosyltransferase family 4 protein [Peribacillus sp. Hz7]|uniref:glycosyltransferase family 4 protein n=1 Tax=Peribacillus sp. Hz7 TaxID=3344873 RepID=UPI0035CB23A2